jgi:hypothetical protein
MVGFPTDSPLNDCPDLLGTHRELLFTCPLALAQAFLNCSRRKAHFYFHPHFPLPVA